MQLPEDFKDFIELVNLANVRYLVIGGWAVNRYVEPRFTGDIDFFVDATPDTEVKLRSVLTKFGFGEALPSPEISLFQTKVIMLGRPPNRIDILTAIDGVTFEEAWETREMETVGGSPIAFISREKLIQNKAASGRDKDLLDLKSLQSKQDSGGDDDDNG